MVFPSRFDLAAATQPDDARSEAARPLTERMPLERPTPLAAMLHPNTTGLEAKPQGPAHYVGIAGVPAIAPLRRRVLPAEHVGGRSLALGA
jgi:hypothetical protein